MNPAPLQGDPSHTYVGRDSRGDIWQIVDSAGNVIEWAVTPGADSRAVLPGSTRNLGPVATMVVAPPITQPTYANNAPLQGDPSHQYVRTDASGDVWSLRDADGNLLQWSVISGHDSREVISGSMQNLGNPSISFQDKVNNAINQNTSIAVNTTPVTKVNPPAVVVATPVINTTNQNPSNNTLIQTNVSQTQNPSNVNVAPINVQTQNTSSAVPSFAQIPRSTQGDTRHVYVGRDSRGDVWQIFDGFNVIEWAVAYGADSRNIIAGSARNLGPPSAGTIAQQTLANVTVPSNATPTVVTPTVVTPPNTPATNNAIVGDGAGHTYAGRDSQGNDLWQLTDSAGNVIRWAVLSGHDSREVIPGTLQNLGMTGSVKSTVNTSATTSGNPNTNAGGGGIDGVAGGTNTNLTAAQLAAIANQTVPHGPQGDPSHVFVGRDNTRGDIWQLVDSTGIVIEWAVAFGADSRAIIPGSTRNLGPVSIATVAQTYVPPTANNDSSASPKVGTNGITDGPATPVSPVGLLLTAAGLAFEFLN